MIERGSRVDFKLLMSCDGVFNNAKVAGYDQLCGHRRTEYEPECVVCLVTWPASSHSDVGVLGYGCINACKILLMRRHALQSCKA